MCHQSKFHFHMWRVKRICLRAFRKWHILTVHAQPFRGARDLAFCLKVPPDSLLVWARSGGSGETARMHRLVWNFAARIGDKYQIRLTRSILSQFVSCRINLHTSSWLTKRKSAKLNVLVNFCRFCMLLYFHHILFDYAEFKWYHNLPKFTKTDLRHFGPYWFRPKSFRSHFK